MILCGKVGRKLYYYYEVDEDAPPIIFIDVNNDIYTLHYLQKDKESVNASLGIHAEGYSGFDINKNNREEILLDLCADVMAKYNYQTNQAEKLGTYEKLEEVYSLYSNGYGIKEIRFVPDSNNISFVISDRIFVYEYETEQYKEVYQFNGDCYGRLGFSHEWKNDKELYLIKSKNLILYNIETKEGKIVLEDIGTGYFQMSDDEKYITYQAQCGEKRGFYLIDLDSGKEKKIHTAKSGYKVQADFSPDNKYIFIIDYPKYNDLGIRYFYLYDIDKEKKYHLDMNDLDLGWFVGWGK